jgi:thioredoxin-related protein
MKALKIIVLLVAIAAVFFWRRHTIFGPSPTSGVPIASLKAPAHVLNTLRFGVEAANNEARTFVLHFSLANCPPCDRLDNEVLYRPEWKQFVRENVKLIDIFMPNEFTQDDVRIVKNMELIQAVHDAMGSRAAFPTMAVITSDGRIVGTKVGYDGSGVPGYIAWIEKMRKADPNRPTKPKPSPPAATPPASTTSVTPPAKPAPVATVLPAPPSPPAAPAPPVALAPVTNTVVVAATEPPKDAPKPTPESFIKLKGILSGTPPFALINSGIKTYTVGSGDSLTLVTPSGNLPIRCESVTKDTVTILIGETRQRLDLRLQ